MSCYGFVNPNSAERPLFSSSFHFFCIVLASSSSNVSKAFIKAFILLFSSDMLISHSGFNALMPYQFADFYDVETVFQPVAGFCIKSPFLGDACKKGDICGMFIRKKKNRLMGESNNGIPVVGKAETWRNHV